MAGGINQVNVGRDVQLQIVTPDGILPIDITTSFDARAMYDKRRSRPINGAPLSVPIPNGWEGTFEFDRQDGSLEAYFAAQEAGYFAGNGIRAVRIQETIVNATDDETGVFQYQRVMLTFDDAGRKQADDIIKMRVSWEASRRLKIQ